MSAALLSLFNIMPTFLCALCGVRVLYYNVSVFRHIIVRNLLTYESTESQTSDAFFCCNFRYSFNADKFKSLTKIHSFRARHLVATPCNTNRNGKNMNWIFFWKRSSQILSHDVTQLAECWLRTTRDFGIYVENDFSANIWFQGFWTRKFLFRIEVECLTSVALLMCFGKYSENVNLT